MEWKQYTQNRLIAKNKSGFFVIIPSEMSKGTPIFCPVCSFIMSSHYDEKTYEEYSCCDACSSEWARRNKSKWLDGWRPTEEEIKSVINRRKASNT